MERIREWGECVFLFFKVPFELAYQLFIARGKWKQVWTPIAAVALLLPLPASFALAYEETHRWQTLFVTLAVELVILYLIAVALSVVAAIVISIMTYNRSDRR